MSVASLVRMKVERESAAPPPNEPKKTVSEALNVVAAYIPSEVIAIYTFVLALTVPDAPPGPEKGEVPALPFPVFWAFLAAIPLFVWLTYAVRLVEGGKPLPWSPSSWPLWEIIAAAVAFTVWSAALPKSALLEAGTWYSPANASIALIVVAALLPMIGTLVTRSRDSK